MSIRGSVGKTAGIAAATVLAGIALAVPAQASTAYIWGSDISIGSCKAWMNGDTSNFDVQGLVQSWGDTCEMRLWQSTDGGKTWHHASYGYSVSSGHRTDQTGWHSAGSGYRDQSHVCLTNWTRQVALCGGTYHH